MMSNYISLKQLLKEEKKRKGQQVTKVNQIVQTGLDRLVTFLTSLFLFSSVSIFPFLLSFLYLLSHLKSILEQIYINFIYFL